MISKKNIAVQSNDIRLCNQIAVMCSENNFEIVFINEDYQFPDKPDYIIVDLDDNLEKSLVECKKYFKNHKIILVALSVPIQSTILKAKKAGCLMVLIKSNFSANVLDIIKKIR